MPRLKPETTAARKYNILKAAMVCFARKGYHQTTMDDIVEETGLSKGGLYVHFNSKKDLFLALFDWFIEEFGLFAIPTEAGSTTYEKLMNTLAGMIMTINSNTFWEISALMTDVWAQNAHDEEINQMVMRLYGKVRKPLVELIEEGMAEGSFKPVDATAVANILIAVFEGLMIQAMADERAVDWTAASRTLSAMLDGLLLKS